MTKMPGPSVNEQKRDKQQGCHWQPPLWRLRSASLQLAVSREGAQSPLFCLRKSQRGNNHSGLRTSKTQDQALPKQPLTTLMLVFQTHMTALRFPNCNCTVLVHPLNRLGLTIWHPTVQTCPGQWLVLCLILLMDIPFPGLLIAIPSPGEKRKKRCWELHLSAAWEEGWLQKLLCKAEAGGMA